MPLIRNYAKYIPIVQSSGMGKSKTVDKVATERILFPMCLRDDIGGAYHVLLIVDGNSITFAPAHPPTDVVVRDYFNCAPSTNDERRCKRYIRSFLSSLFTLALDQFEKLLPPDKKVPYAYMAKTIHKLFADPLQRYDFYKNVVAIASNGRPYIDVSVSFEKLMNKLKQRCSNWLPSESCPILISIDEVQTLYTHRVVDNVEYSLFAALKSVMNELIMHPFVIISLSTAIHDSSLTPWRPKEIPPSMHAGSRERILPAPLTELPFDVFVDSEPLAPGQAILTSVGSLEFTAKFGRPL